MNGTTPEPGDLLVASAVLTDGVFDQTVVLVLDSDEDGALGVILNEISQMTLESVLPDWVPTVERTQAALPRRTGVAQRRHLPGQPAGGREEPPGWRRLFDRVGLLHLDTPIEIVAGAYADLRIFAGYAGWSPGQLAGEVAQQMWHVVHGRVRRRVRPPADRVVAPGAAPPEERARLPGHLGRGPRAELIQPGCSGHVVSAGRAGPIGRRRSGGPVRAGRGPGQGRSRRSRITWSHRSP